MTRDEARSPEAAQRSPFRIEKQSSTPDTADPQDPRPDQQIRKHQVDAADHERHAAPGRRPLFGS
jgi:hypothetical protein